MSVVTRFANPGGGNDALASASGLLLMSLLLEY
jgi:hypothetical protein